jgi:agmatine deiminase
MVQRVDAAAPAPVHDGFYMPAEWEPHKRTWMCWPTRMAAFGDDERFLRAKQAYARVARAISGFEPVIVVARHEDVAEAKLATGGKVDVLELALDDSWARDMGPTFLANGRGRVAGVQWRFNAWGDKYHPYANDATLARRILDAIGLPAYQAPIVCEGGALHADGEGTVLTTEQCLLNANRNPGLTKARAEEALAHYLGARKVIWLGDGFSDLETDGHVDNIACFAGPGRVVVGVPQSKSHPDHAPVQEALRRLRESTDARGRPFEIVELPQPKKLRQQWNGSVLEASYVNFYLPNGAIVMPAFDDANDEPARAVLADCFPGRDIMQIAALDIVEGGGGIHCITQQEPLTS